MRWEAYLIEWNISDLQPTANRFVEQHPSGGPPNCIIGHHERRRRIEERSVYRRCHRRRRRHRRRAHPQPVPFHCTATTSQTAVKGETIWNYSPASWWPSGGEGGQRDTAPVAQGTGRRGRCQSQPGIFAWQMLLSMVYCCLLLVPSACSCPLLPAPLPHQHV